jgi:hypothetical protein
LYSGGSRCPGVPAQPILGLRCFGPSVRNAGKSSIHDVLNVVLSEGLLLVASLEIREQYVVCAKSFHVASLGLARRRKRTPGPPPFSSMNSTPAVSNVRRTVRSFAAVMLVSFSDSQLVGLWPDPTRTDGLDLLRSSRLERERREFERSAPEARSWTMSAPRPS